MKKSKPKVKEKKKMIKMRSEKRQIYSIVDNFAKSTVLGDDKFDELKMDHSSLSRDFYNSKKNKIKLIYFLYI